MELFVRIIPIFLLIGLGIGVARFNIFPKNFMDSVSKLVFYIGLPALLIGAISGSNVNSQVLWPAINIAISLPVGFLLVIGSSYLLFGRESSARRGTWIQTSIQANLAMMGLPLMWMLYGQESLLQAGLMIALVIIMQNIFVVTEYLYYGELSKAHTHSILLGLLKNPTIISTLFAIILVLLEIRLPMVINSTLKILADMVLPLALLNIGNKIAHWNLQSDLKNLIYVSIFKLIIFPTLALIIGLSLGMEGLGLNICVLALASPCSSTSAIIAAEMGGDAESAASAVSLTYAFSPFTFSFWIFILHS